MKVTTSSERRALGHLLAGPVRVEPGYPTAAAGRDSARRPVLTIIVPTYHEVENLPRLIERIDAVRRSQALACELLIMDDQSGDGTEALIESLDLDWVRLVVRQGDRGLSRAVLDGLRMARGEFIVVMDADLSHPPEAIPHMLAMLQGGSDMVLGSRYAAGGSTDEQWGWFRRLNSRAATLLARPLTSARDPMAGFFALRRDLLDRADPLNPVGYKIGLELIVKCRCRNIGEVPIRFADRQEGESKLTWKEQLKYLRHLRRLLIYRYPNAACFLQFAIVGLTGTIVNLAVLTLLLRLGSPLGFAAAAAIAVSMVSNFIMNRRFTFAYAREGSVIGQFIGFVAACSLGAAVNYGVTLGVYHFTPGPGVLPQVAALVGIAAGMGVNFLFNRFFVFRRPAV